MSDANISFDAKCVSCAHPANVTGVPLQATCGSCEQKICSQDAYCCKTAWDAICVSEAAASCALCEP